MMLLAAETADPELLCLNLLEDFGILVNAAIELSPFFHKIINIAMRSRLRT